MIIEVLELSALLLSYIPSPRVAMSSTALYTSHSSPLHCVALNNKLFFAYKVLISVTVSWIDPAQTEARADSSDETDTSFAERSFCLNYGKKDSEDSLLAPSLGDREEHLDAPPGDGTWLELAGAHTENWEPKSSDPRASAPGSSQNKDEAHMASSAEEAWSPRDRGRPDDRSLKDLCLCSIIVLYTYLSSK